MLPEGSSSRGSASVHGSRASSVSRSSVSPEEQKLADDLQTANVILESHGRSTSTSSISSTDSEARDSLKEREAKERSMEFIRRHCQVHAHVSPSGSQATSSEQKSSGRGRLAGAQLTSARVLGLASGSDFPGEHRSTPSRGSSTPTATTSDKVSSGSSDLTRFTKGLKTNQMSMGDLTDKIADLEKSLASRDAEAKILLQSCEVLEEENNESLAKVKKELAAALKAKDIAEREHDRLEIKAAGDKARYDDNMAYELQENEKHVAVQKRHEQELADAQKLLATARSEREKSDIDEAHAVASQELSAGRIKELEKALATSTAKLSAVHTKGGYAPSRYDTERDLRAEIKEMEEEKQETGKEMSKIRLELLGLKRDRDKSKVVDQREQASSSRQGRRGKGPRKGQGKGNFLEIIDEEDDDLPETRSLDNVDLASECVSSDHETCSAADLSAQKDLVAKLLNQLHDQKRAMQDLKAEHAGSNAEQIQQIEVLMKEISESNRNSENMAEEHQVLKQREKSNRLDNIKKLDLLQRTLRTMQGRLDDQDVAMQEQNRTAEASEINQVNLEEQLQLQTEALRITSLRLQDALQQHENDTFRHQQEQSTLKLQLAVERKKVGSYAADVEASTTEVTLTQAEFLEQRVKELQEEKSALLGKLEIKDVQFQLELEEMQREHANKMQEQQRLFHDQLAQLRSATALQIGAFEQASTGGAGEWIPSSSSLVAERDGSGGSSQALASAVSGTASPHARSECEGTEASGSSHTRALGGAKGLIWNILCILPNVAAMICSAEGILIQNMTQRAAILLGSNLIGKSFYTLVKEENVMSLQRTITATQPPTESQGEYPAEDLTRTLARHQLEAPNRGPVDLLISAVHLSAGSAGDRHILILLVEQPSDRTHNLQSVASSDICPSDSISVGRRRPQLMRSEVQRTKLRASFFSTRQSARDGSSSNSSPRSSFK